MLRPGFDSPIDDAAPWVESSGPISWIGSSGSPAALSAASSCAMSPFWEMPVTTRPTRYLSRDVECTSVCFCDLRPLLPPRSPWSGDRHAMEGRIEGGRADEREDRRAETDQPDQRRDGPADQRHDLGGRDDDQSEHQ